MGWNRLQQRRESSKPHIGAQARDHRIALLRRDAREQRVERSRLTAEESIHRLGTGIKADDTSR